ncbi:hypothetical protein TCAL_15163 [Tigriopus californicus]|uniref:RNA-directed DNA polymerase n=1 Tax=Tigriopus californicus TaxID=6832 RepID=A0A553NU14_TIGCA|nr:hypothetical protein TCAL_15163 [Tigriopus californicus]
MKGPDMEIMLKEGPFTLLRLDQEDESLLLLGDRIIVPAGACQEIIRILHLPHQGLTKTKQAARQLYFWPGMNAAIKNAVTSCQACQKFMPSQQPEPLHQIQVGGPMEMVSADLFDWAGQSWLVLVDSYSGYLIASRLFSINTDIDFCPGGRMEREKFRYRKQEQSESRARPLPILEPGTNVLVQNPITKLWDTSSKIISILDSSRSYVISDGEKTFRWNRKFIRPQNPPIRLGEIIAVEVLQCPASEKSTRLFPRLSKKKSVSFHI